MDKENYWDKLMGTDEGAANYMASYGEGPGFDTRQFISNFINDGERVLDVGCGPGWNLDHFQQYGPQIGGYRGLDYSERFIRVANLRHKADHNQRFRVGDARSLKEPDGSWDVVLLQDILEHTNGYEKPVKEALRVARKRVIISFWHLTMDDNEHTNDDGDDGYGSWYNGHKWEAFLNSLPYPWMDDEIHPEGRNHSWHFYIINKASHEE